MTGMAPYPRGAEERQTMAATRLMLDNDGSNFLGSLGDDVGAPLRRWCGTARRR
jgi:hypothetical protein